MSDSPPAPDTIELYDPLLGSVQSTVGHPHARGGYRIWPDGARVAAADHRLMCIGNSTSRWPDAAWSLALGQSLSDAGHKVAIYNGAGSGNTSSQEVLRVLRDAPGIAPTMILSLSGICDIGYLQSAKGYPFSHKYTRRITGHLQDTGVVTETTAGYPHKADPAAIWCHNQRMARALAEAMGITLRVFLQPVMGFGRYDLSAEEATLLTRKGAVVLKAADRPYIDCVQAFYTEVRATLAADPAGFAHVTDLTDVFADCPGAYRDHRHQTPEGVAHLARAILRVVAADLGPPG